MATDDINPGIIKTPSGFHYAPVDFDPESTAPDPTQAPLGVLSNFVGVFAGTGFNTIFRPNNDGNSTKFPNPVSGPPIPNPPNENVLELNLTTETLTFANPLGSVPNRGLGKQHDLSLNGVPYVQAIKDVTNTLTGKADGSPTDIHFEPGLWINVPATTVDPVLPASLARLASIPHGTTINAQTITPPISFPGPPKINSVDITPFIINSNPPKKFKFAAQTASSTDTPRLPQNLGPFIAAGTITQEILDDPNTVLRNAIVGQKIVNTIVFEVSTNPPSPGIGGGTSNIAFLEGTGGGIQGNSQDPNANADAATASAIFWIETVEHEIEIPIWQPGHPPINFGSAASPTNQAPQFVIVPPHAIAAPKTIKVHTTQIQYSQTVNLNFAGLTWPHVSVATLVPAAPQNVPESAWK